MLGSTVVSEASATQAGMAPGRGRSLVQAAHEFSGFDRVAAPMQDTEMMARFCRTLGTRVQAGERICSIHLGDHKINFRWPQGVPRQGLHVARTGRTASLAASLCLVLEGTEEVLGDTLALANAEIVAGLVPRRARAQWRHWG